jgi:deoxyribose-phosphate aldolase
MAIQTPSGETMTRDIRNFIDAAVLNPELSMKEVRSAVEMCISHNVKSVCVRPCDLEVVVEMCRGMQTAPSCVLSFPHGNVPGACKAREAEVYIDRGAREIDMVANYGWIKSGERDRVIEDISLVSNHTKKAGVILKVILETSMLTIAETGFGTSCAIDGGADFVKSSTGFAGGGAEENKIAEMVCVSADRILVKASGGIYDYERARLFLALGCSRLGIGYSSIEKILSDELANG